MQEVELPRKGKLITYTIIRRPPTEFEDQDPFAVGIVELQNGVRVLSQLTDIELKDVHSGMKLEAVLRKYRQEGEAGLIIYGIKFRPLLPRDGKKESSRDAD